MTSSFTQIMNIARGGMLSTMLNLDVVSNNVANINTNGFKRSRSNFQELLDQKQLEGTQIRATQTIMDKGSLASSDNPLDLAINGGGLFAVKLPDERIAYTRNGQFSLDGNNQLVTASGNPVVMDGEIPAGIEDFHVNPDGTVMTRIGDTWSQSGTIQLYKVANPGAMLSYGQNLWLDTPVSGEAQAGTPGTGAYGTVVGSAIEKSNTDLAEDFVQMDALKRSFEMSLHTFQQTDQMLAEAIQMRKG